MANMTGKVALVTGGANGQGEAEAVLLVRAGARVVISDVEVDKGEALADRLGPTACFARLDVSDEASWAAAMDVVREFGRGRLDVLVNNAGVFWWRPIPEESRESMESMLAVNAIGPALGIKHASPLMAEGGGGSIINIGSVAGRRPEGRQISYAMAKFAIRGLTHSAALELGPDGIRVNLVLPGPIDTRMYHAAVAGAPPLRGSGVPRSVSGPSTPLGRMGEAHDVASLVVFLASDDASFITGAEIVIDGGRTL